MNSLTPQIVRGVFGEVKSPVDVWRIVVPGKPQVWERAGAMRQNGELKFFTRPAAKDAKERWRSLLRAEMLRRGQMKMPLFGNRPVMVSLLGVWPATKAHPEGWMTARPDLDNVLKGILDHANSILYEDDSQVVGTLGPFKVVGSEPRLELVIWPVDDSAYLDWIAGFNALGSKIT